MCKFKDVVLYHPTKTLLKHKARENHFIVVGVAWAKYWDVCTGIISRCPIVACSPRRSPASTLLGEDCDHVVALRRSRPLACVLLTINAVLHKEMSLVFQVDVAVRTGVAVRVTELVPQLDHHSPEAQIFFLLKTNKQTKITLNDTSAGSPDTK